MAERSRHDGLVHDLAASLSPVRRLASPGRRAAGWCVAVLAGGLLLLPFSDWHALQARLEPWDLRLSALGAALTAMTAALATFQTSVPGRPAAWALLPAAPLALWIASSGYGCLRGWVAPASNLAGGTEMAGCLTFLLGVSLPLTGLTMWMVRRACPLRPDLTAALAGLAVAAAAALLLLPLHPHDATAADLAVHAAGILVVIALNVLVGGRAGARASGPGLSARPGG